jgi:hypothetical protein
MLLRLISPAEAGQRIHQRDPRLLIKGVKQRLRQRALVGGAEDLLMGEDGAYHRADPSTPSVPWRRR